jgi:hypothetical protein
MDWIKKHYERALVVVCGVIALLGSGWLIISATSFPSQFVLSTVTPGTRLESLSDDLVTAAIRQLTGAEPWVRPKVGQHKTIPVSASTPFVVMHDKPSEPFDMMADDAPKLRDPIENWWLVENDLDYTTTEVKQSDPDRDGFTNLDEWEGKTNPNSSLSKPTFDTKLYYAEHLLEPLTLRLSSFDAGTAAIRFSEKNASGADVSHNEYIKVGAASKDGRFKVVDVKTETVKRFNTDTIVPVATVEDVKRGNEKIRLPQGVPTDHPTSIAKIIYTLTNQEFLKKAGEDFEVNRPIGTTITVLEVHPDSIVIEFVPEGKTEPIKMKKDLRPPPK